MELYDAGHTGPWDIGMHIPQPCVKTTIFSSNAAFYALSIIQVVEAEAEGLFRGMVCTLHIKIFKFRLHVDISRSWTAEAEQEITRLILLPRSHDFVSYQHP
jgi:hypothetical protein